MAAKIAKISTFVLRVPLGVQRFYSSQCAFPERTSLLVRVQTEDGLVGWGEGGQYGPAEPVAVCVRNVLAPLVVGQDPLAPEVLWQRMYAHVRDFGSRGPYIEAISALDIAFWDICGKARGTPVYELLGGAFRTQVQAYATGCYYRGENHLDMESALPALAAEAAGYTAAGFRMIKAKVGLLSVEADTRRLAAIREGAGRETVLLVDCNHAYNGFTAVRMARKLEGLDVRWIEEPVPPEDLEGYRYVRDRVEMAVAGGECDYTRYGFRDLIAGGCVDIAQPDICVSGGLSEWRKISALASAWGIWALPHVWGSGVALAAALHAVAAMPPFPHTANPVGLQNEPVIEYDRNPNPLRDELLAEPIEFCCGSLVVPSGPGLGVTIDEEVLGRYVAVPHGPMEGDGTYERTARARTLQRHH
jgi:D-galactarolactone cycloisomerase